MRPLFTPEELKELRRADQEIEDSFRLTAEEYRATSATDREIAHDRKSAKEKKVAAYNRAYREANREKVAAYNRAYREANREKVAAYNRAYREANREKVAAYNRAYYQRKKNEVFCREAF